MAIYIFESPILDWHKNEDTIDSISGYKPSYKMIEFHNCEFDYNSIKSGWGTLDNKTGFSPEYSIDIKYDDCYEVSYNEFMMKTLGDVILTDLIDTTRSDVDTQIISTIKSEKTSTQKNGLKKRDNPYDKGFLGNAINQLISTGVNYLEDKLERAILGNLHTYSLTKISDQVKSALRRLDRQREHDANRACHCGA